MSAELESARRRPIRQLTPDTIDKIAAGEVVERPASVVKELVENAVDAGANEVRVEIAGGGLDRIRVDDNGGGILPEELPLAVERHATSKIERADDLHQVRSLGFRGEALAAIGSVARLELVSRVPGRDEAYALTVTGGRVGAVSVAGRPPGTTVEVRDLFFNTPARRKFLKSAPAEQVEVAATLERLYLANPRVQLVLVNETGEVARFPRSDSLADAAARVFGAEFLAQSLEVRADLPSGGTLEGVLGRPALSRTNSRSLHLSVNGRAIASRSVAQAVRVAYTDYMPRTRFPVGALALELDPTRIDVNVHPTKRELRFADERPLDEAIRHAVRHALESMPHAAAPRLPAPGAPAAGARAPLSPSPLVVPLASGHQRSLLEPSAPVRVAPTARTPGLELVGCLFATYWIAETAQGLRLVDQHAASERVLFDALRREERLGRQELLQPLTIALGPTARTALAAHAEEIRRAGFEIESFGGDRVRVVAVPSYLGRTVRPDAVEPFLQELSGGGRPTLPDGLTERVAASIACHAAVRAGDEIEPDEMRRILSRLYRDSESAYACPHGRPIAVELPRSQLDRWFLRSSA